MTTQHKRPSAEIRSEMKDLGISLYPAALVGAAAAVGLVLANVASAVLTLAAL